MAEETAPEMSLKFDLPSDIDLEALDIEEADEQTAQKFALETLKARTEKHNENVLAKVEGLEDSQKASLIKRKFVVGLVNVKVNPPGTGHQDVVNGKVVQKITKGYSVSCNRKYAGGKMSKDIHYPLNI